MHTLSIKSVATGAIVAAATLSSTTWTTSSANTAASSSSQSNSIFVSGLTTISTTYPTNLRSINHSHNYNINHELRDSRRTQQKHHQQQRAAFIQQTRNNSRLRVVLSSNAANAQETVASTPTSESSIPHSSSNGEILMTSPPLVNTLQENDSNSDNNNNNMQPVTTSISHTIPQDTFTLPPAAAPSLDGRLLCASQCAYSIKPPYFKSTAYRPATTAKRLSKGVNSVLIGHTIDGICIAFRGTQTSSPLDWLQNAALFLSDVESGRKNPIKGKIHTGFYRGTKSLWKPLKSTLKGMLEESAANGWKQDVILTGHSKGGAMATIAAVMMKRDSDLPDPSYVCTFASAKVGDSEFCQKYNKNINQTSYEAHLDLIPFLPPSSATMDMMDETMTNMMDSMLWSDTSIQKKDKFVWDYQTVGKRKFITENYEIIEDVTKELDEQRIKAIEKSSFLAINDFLAAHCSSCASEDCNGYYFNAIASTVCNEDSCSIDDDGIGAHPEQQQQRQDDTEVNTTEVNNDGVEL